MSTVYFANIFGTVISVVKIEYFLSRDYVIKVTEDEKNRKMCIEFLQYTEIID